jgi:hypothetical protein
MPAPASLVHQTSASIGTGNLTVIAVNGRRAFSAAFGTGGTDVFDYFVMNRDAAEWERGTGHMSDSNTLVRDTVIESSNSNNAVNFSSGTKDVCNDVPPATQWKANFSPTVEFRTSSATITIPTGYTKALVTLWGGSGGGGGAKGNGSGNAAAAGSGAGAGALKKLLTGLTPGNTLALTIGAAGAAGATTPANGGNGGNSSLASGTETITTLTANGGGGGTAANGVGALGSPGTGGTATNGDLNITGQTPTPPTVGGGDPGYAMNGGVSGLGMSMGGNGARTDSASGLAGNAGVVGGCIIQWFA